MSSLENFMIPIIFFNLSVIFHGISMVIFSLGIIKSREDRIKLKSPSKLNSREGTIEIGNIIKNRKKFFLSLKDFEKHMFICGATGTGKTNFLQNLLINFTKNHHVPFFLVEFKGEYHFLQKKIKNLLILWPGRNFSINIFNPENTNPIIHAERIFDILKSIKLIDNSNSEYSPQMEKVLVEILIKTCSTEKLRGWDGFEKCCQEYLEQNKNAIPMLKQTLISVKNRIRRYSEGPLSALFDKERHLEVKKIFDHNILLDLSSIIHLGGDKEDALFFLNIILKYLWDMNLTRGALDYSGIKHITIVEDAQYFAPQDLIKKKKITTYLEDIALLQRGTGECLITLATRPDISEEILANCGVIAIFKNHMEREFLCKLLNLDIDKEKYLSSLDEGECIVRISSINKPFLLKIPLIHRHSLELSDIKMKNEKILQILKNYKIDEKLRDQIVSKKLKDRILHSLYAIKRRIINLFNKIKKKIRILRKDDNRRLLNNVEYKNNIREKDKKIEFLNDEKEEAESFEFYITKLIDLQEKKE